MERQRARGIGARARALQWNKIALLLRGPVLLPECDVLGYIDTDAMMIPEAGPLTRQWQIARWLDGPKALFIAREPQPKEDTEHSIRSFWKGSDK